MSTVEEIQAAIPKLSAKELADLKQWLDEFCEDQLELADEVKAKLDQSRAEIAAGQYRTRQP
jgi:ABC-type phosphate transport system ATPase subunit